MPTTDIANFEKRLREGSTRPLVVRPRIARRMLGGIGTMKLWSLINTGALDSYLDGRSRMITVESIERYVARLLGDARDEAGRLRQWDDPALTAPLAGGTHIRRGRASKQRHSIEAREAP